MDLAEEVHRRALIEGYSFRTVGLKIRFDDFETHTRAKSLPEFTFAKGPILRISQQLLKEFEDDPRKVRLIGVRVTNLKRQKAKQETLLTWA